MTRDALNGSLWRGVVFGVKSLAALSLFPDRRKLISLSGTEAFY
jgi:hypothetical protein